jgi:hypothetical protein
VGDFNSGSALEAICLDSKCSPGHHGAGRPHCLSVHGLVTGRGLHPFKQGALDRGAADGLGRRPPGEEDTHLPIDIRFSMRAVSQGVGPDHSAAPLEEDDDSGDHSRRRRLGHPSSHPRSPPRRGNHGPEPATGGGERHCRPVHERLGPAADTGGHVE